MVLHRSNFEIPAQFSFQPYSVKWRLVTAETVQWTTNPNRLMRIRQTDEELEKDWVQVRIGESIYGGLEALYGIGDSPSCTFSISRTSIPPDELQPHENYRNTPDIAGRPFQVLICEKPEFKQGLWALKPGDAQKNAWIMRDEFLGLEADSELGWDWSVRQFLNKWGLWRLDRGYESGSYSVPGSAYASLSRLAYAPLLNDNLGLVIILPHWLKEHQERYRLALTSTARSWLRMHPVNLDTAAEFPFYRVQKSCCVDAIDATITIDHLSGVKHGICKRCRKVFEKETRHKKNYCSERCFNAAGVQRWREKQRKAAKKGAKRNAKG